MTALPDDARFNSVPANWPIDPADPEAAELREAWSALEQFLGPSAAPLDDVTTARIVRHVLRREDRRRQQRWGLAALAAAAALLFFLGKPQLPQNPSPQEDAPPIAHKLESPTAPAPGDSPTWNDPFDQELAAVRDQVLAVELDWSRSDDSFNHFGERLQALETEWSESPL